MSAPSVSVIIPTYNRRDLVQRALESVFVQTYRDFEIMVVDDGSTDDTRAVVEGRDRVRYLCQANAGPASARNLGIRHARGGIIAFLDSDDVWWPDFLETQLDVLSHYPEVALVCARSVVEGKEAKYFPLEVRSEPLDYAANIVEEKEAKYFPLSQELIVGDLYLSLYQQSFVRTPATVVRKSCLDAVGYFNESYLWSEDHDLWLRIASKYTIAYVNRCLVRIGRQSDNISRDLTRPLDAHLKIAVEVLERNYDASRIPQTVFRRRIAKRYLQFSQLFFKRGENAKAWFYIWRALSLAPCSLRPYRYLLKGIFRSLSIPRFS
jgi:glycosyltransferase involved in cell wall biosynthesis